MRNGFTLLELLIVVIIIGILASMAIPQYQKVIRKAKAAEALTNLAALRCSMDRYWYEQVAGGGQYVPVDWRMNVQGNIILDVDNPNDVDNRKWAYGVAVLGGFLMDRGTQDGADFVLQAQELVNGAPVIANWIEIDEDGNISKSRTFGGENEHLIVGN